MRDVLRDGCAGNGAGPLHTGQAGTDHGPRAVPAPKASSRHREAAPASFTDTQSPSWRAHTLQSPHCCCHGVPDTPAQEGPAWMDFWVKTKAFLAWRALQHLTSLGSASLCNSRWFLATLQLLQPFFISLFSSGLGQPGSSTATNLWDGLGAGEHPALDTARGGQGSPPGQGGGGACPAPVPAPQAFGRDTANSNCNFHSGGCAPQAKSVLSL